MSYRDPASARLHEELLRAPLDELAARARALREEGHGRLQTYSPKVFIPLTKLCRDVCHYCTFARPPRRGQRAYLLLDEVLAIAAAGAAAGCHEALFTLGDKPELRYRAARTELQALGCDSTVQYLARCAERVLEDTGLLPHVNPGVLGREQLTLLRGVSASAGLMLESSSERLMARGMPHFGSPDKRPAARLATLELAGELAVPFTTGILIGIGETRAERLDALALIAAAHARHGHVQEVIVQNFRAKPGTKMAAAPEPELEELLWTIAAARILLGPQMNLQAPPNLSGGDLEALLQAGINDWGGVSPVTIDHVNPEAPWPGLERLRAATERAGYELAPRLAVYPEYLAAIERWCEPAIATAVRRRADASGLAREDDFLAGVSTTIRADDPTRRAVLAGTLRTGAARVGEVLAKAQTGAALAEVDVIALFEARGRQLEAVFAAADRLRGIACGDTVSYVVTRNINYTNVCYFRCGFCAFSKGKLAENLRGPAYLVPVEEIVRRCHEAWARGATEVLRGHKKRAARAASARVLRARGLAGRRHAWRLAGELPRSLEGAGAGVAARHRRRDPRRRGSSRPLPRQGLHGAVARGARDRAPRRAALDRDDHVRARRIAAQLGAAPARPARPAGAHRWLHGARPAAVRPRRGPDLPQGPRSQGPDAAGGDAHARGRAARPAPAHHQRAGLLAEARHAGRSAGAPRRRQRLRRNADERVDLARRRSQPRPGDGTRGDRGGDPRDRADSAPAHDVLRNPVRRADRRLVRRSCAQRAGEPPGVDRSTEAPAPTGASWAGAGGVITTLPHPDGAEEDD
jgi:7,8-didemethyl-8-hydroxy-5-deazariboflavin synthase CofG subunit